MAGPRLHGSTCGRAWHSPSHFPLPRRSRPAGGQLYPPATKAWGPCCQATSETVAYNQTQRPVSPSVLRRSPHGEDGSVDGARRGPPTLSRACCAAFVVPASSSPARTAELRRDDPKLLLRWFFSAGGGFNDPTIATAVRISPRWLSLSTSPRAAAQDPALSLACCGAKMRESARVWGPLSMGASASGSRLASPGGNCFSFLLSLSYMELSLS
jgi:hypothetical protein